MVYQRKRTKKPSYRRRRRRRTSKYSRTVARIPRHALGFPSAYNCKLRYVDTYDLTTDGVTSLSQYAWKLNSLYDPDSTSTGFQPTYFDQLTEIYQRYRVYAVQYKCTIFNKSSNEPIFFNLIETNAASVSQDPASTSMNTLAGKMYMISSEGSNNVKTITRYAPINRVTGATKSAVRNLANYEGATGNFGTGSDPSELAYLILNVDSITPGVNFIVKMEITFYSTFSQVKTVLMS